MLHRLAVLVAMPAHSSIPGPLSYRSELPLAPGTLVRVPLGRREVLGLVWDAADPPGDDRLDRDDKPILGALEGIAPLSANWRQLVTFSANYYQRSIGEVALAALPPQLRGLSALQLARRLGRYEPDRTLPVARNDAFRRRMQAGDFAPACDVAEQSAREFPESPLAWQQVVTAAVQVGQREKALAAVERLVQLVKAKPSGAGAECLVDAYLTSGQPELAIAAARQRIAQQPLSIVAWDSLQQAAFVLGRREDALQAMPEVLRLMGQTDPVRSGFIVRHLARWWMENEPQKAAALLLAAFLLDGNAEETRIAGMVAAPIMKREHFDRALAGLVGASPAACRTFAAVLDEVYADKDAETWGGRAARPPHRHARSGAAAWRTTRDPQLPVPSGLG